VWGLVLNVGKVVESKGNNPSALNDETVSSFHLRRTRLSTGKGRPVTYSNLDENPGLVSTIYINSIIRDTLNSSKIFYKFFERAVYSYFVLHASALTYIFSSSRITFL